MEKIKFNGVLPEINKDPRNYTISQFIPGKDRINDEEFMLKFPQKEIIIDQGSISACVGHSFVMAKQILEYQQTNKWIDFDPFILYGTRYDDDYVGEGMYPFQGAKALYKDGAYFRRDFGKRQEMPQLKNTVEQWKKNNPDKVLKAKDYTITGYSYVNSEQAIKRALKNGMPVSVAYPIYASFYDTGKNGIVKVPDTLKEELYGYHQMLIVGWTKDNKWIVVNSWGTRYGLKGMYLIPFENEYDSAIAVSDTITPSTYKAKELSFTIDQNEYIVDGATKVFDSVPYIKDDRTYVSVRFITEALGCSVEWIEDTRKVIIRSEEAIIEMQIGNKEYYIDGKKRINDVAPEIVNDRTMLPIRFIAEALNCSVEWINDTRTVKIKSL